MLACQGFLKGFWMPFGVDLYFQHFLFVALGGALARGTLLSPCAIVTALGMRNPFAHPTVKRELRALSRCASGKKSEELVKHLSENLSQIDAPDIPEADTSNQTGVGYFD